VSTIERALERARQSQTLGPQIAASLVLPAEREAFAARQPELEPRLTAALRSLGINRLWTHQAAGVEAVRARRDTLVTTPTASGKSLVFHLPVLDDALRGGEGRALFLYPLKALGQDQRRKLEALARRAGLADERELAAIYDGDTPAAERARIKRRFPRVVISNPDMLHLGILGSWQAWEPFLRRLEWIVLDELHVYRGIFGSHFHHVLQRLMRLCRLLGADPVVVASSATAANADGFAAALAGRPFVWISESGAPRARRHMLMMRPATSPYTLTLELLVFLLERGLKTIVFTKARRITELLVTWLGRQHPSLAARVRGYRSGFLPDERREIERALAGGRLDGVIATSALEMGIDIGGLDACILVGFPGSVMATWQRSGRVGRGESESITALIALPDALDQFFLDHPAALVGRPLEQLIIDPANESVARAHLVCAAAEAALSAEKDAAYLTPLSGVVDELTREGLLEVRRVDGALAATIARPHREVRLRGIGEPSVICDPRGRLIGTVDGIRVLTECHPGAIYLHQGRQYLVRELDLERRRIVAEPLSIDYYTAPLTEKETAILEVLAERSEGALSACLGRLEVTERVIGYERRKVRGQEAVDRQPLELPAVRFETQGFWWLAPPMIEERIRAEELHFMGALHASEHAAISLLPLLALCDRGDIGGISIPLHPQLECGAVFVYDGHAGGAGIARRAFENLRSLLEKVCELVRACGCESGCPSCIQSPKCGNGNRPLDKTGAILLLEMLLGDTDHPPISARPVREWAPGSTNADEGSKAGPPAKPKRRSGERGDPASEEPRTMLVAVESRSGSTPGSRRLTGAAVCHLEAERVELFDEETVLQLETLLDSARMVVGWGLDEVRALLSAYTARSSGESWHGLDLEAELAGRLADAGSVDDLLALLALESEEAQGHGPRDAPERCRLRVEGLRHLFLFGRREGYVPMASECGARIEVDW
jgi:DEAD/DEAH box helicase domain-containing protein